MYPGKKQNSSNLMAKKLKHKHAKWNLSEDNTH